MLRRIKLLETVTIVALLASITSAASADALQDGLRAWFAGNYAESVRLLSPLADQGNLEAQQIVGGAYANGWGVSKDCTKGVRLLLAAANGGRARAQYAMGRLNSTGTCMVRDYRAALDWFKTSAAQHDPDADFSIGLYYSDMRAAPQNLVEAYRWFYLCIRDGDNKPAGMHNVQAAKNNVNRLNSILSAEDLKRAKALVAQSN